MGLYKLERYGHGGYLIKVVVMALAEEVTREPSPILSIDEKIKLMSVRCLSVRCLSVRCLSGVCLSGVCPCVRNSYLEILPSGTFFQDFPREK
jgi:hypothetical protein